MRCLNKLPANLMPAITTLLVLSLCAGAIRAADQPKATGAKKVAAKANAAKSDAAPQKPKTALVMLGYKAKFHTRPEQVDAFAGLIAGYCHLAANFSDNPADFSVDNIRKYDVVILWSSLSTTGQKERPTQTALENVFQAVEAGTPVLALHGGIFHAAQQVDGSPEIEEKIGARYALGIHYPYQKFTIQIDKAHPITAGISDFDVLDEPYRIDMLAPDAEILATFDPKRTTVHPLSWGNNDKLKQEILLSHQWAEKTTKAPVIYVRTLGKGKIVVNTLGHDEASLRNPSVRALTMQSIQWLLSGK
jgi:type 1 glutamine amidotransferase